MSFNEAKKAEIDAAWAKLADDMMAGVHRDPGRPKPPPLTRKQRIQRLYNGARNRVGHAWLCLRYGFTATDEDLWP